MKRITQTAHKMPVPKRTSIGRSGKPLNRHKRRNWKQYRGQGKP